MTYAIIGAGKVGKALAQQFAKAGLDASIANSRGPDSIRMHADEFGGHVKATTIDDALRADVIVLALPFTAVAQLAHHRTDWRGKIVIDATNAYGVAPEVLAGRLSSDVVAQTLPGASVVKAFNQLPAALLAKEPEQDGGRRVVFIAGNDNGANDKVKALTETLGFAPILLGRIEEGGRLMHIPGPLVLHNLVEHPLK